MSNIVIKQYTFENSTASSHFSKSGGMNLGQAGLVSNPLILWYSNSGTATMNDTGKSFLYPKVGIHPFKADYTFILWNATDSDFTSSPSSYMNFYFKIDGNTIYHKEVAPGKTSSSTTASDAITNDTNSAILNSTSSSSITFEITAQKNGLTQMCGISSTSNAPCFIKFYFQQWDTKAAVVGNGITRAIASGRIYDGETTTFTAEIKDGATWHGWYSDATHTNLVSSSLNYTTTPTSDLTLYAYATYTDRYSNLYVKSGSANRWIKPVKLYIKNSNGWQLQNDSINLTNTPAGKYLQVVREVNLSSLSESNMGPAFKIEDFQCPILYIRNDINNVQLKEWSVRNSTAISQGNTAYLGIKVKQLDNYQTTVIYYDLELISNFNFEAILTLVYSYYDNNNYYEKNIEITISY